MACFNEIASDEDVAIKIIAKLAIPEERTRRGPLLRIYFIRF